jgi:hypothetical protein
MILMELFLIPYLCQQMRKHSICTPFSESVCHLHSIGVPNPHKSVQGRPTLMDVYVRAGCANGTPIGRGWLADPENGTRMDVFHFRNQKESSWYQSNQQMAVF